MKPVRGLSLFFLVIYMSLLSACSREYEQEGNIESSDQDNRLIYLYGESHGYEKIIDREFELWYDYYHNQDMRHLFLEIPYYTAEFLNIWMESSDDEILGKVFSDFSGTAMDNPFNRKLFKDIKTECPETIFHGTDVGHQYYSTGERFLKYLRENNLEGSEQYSITIEVIKQGKNYYSSSKSGYREDEMVGNFIREYDKIYGESIMGIYGAAHTGLDKLDFSNSVPCMANQLKEYYGDIIYSEDLSDIAKDIEPVRVDIIQINGKEYSASYFGEMNLDGFKDYSYREFWRLENAYDDFVNAPRDNDVLPYNDYPMLIDTGQVFVINYTKTDGSVIRKYYVSDGLIWNDMPTTEGFVVK
ncbi:hypothetical protein RI065_10445 [Mycoplasmatota bacterium zrk1]